jgi:hypothetical protein
MESRNIGAIYDDEKEKHGIEKAAIFAIKVTGFIHPCVIAAIFLNFG